MAQAVEKVVKPLKERKGTLEALIVGIVAGFVACYIYEEMKLYGYGETVTFYGVTVYKQFLMFGAIALLMVVYGLVKKKRGLVYAGIGFLVGTEIKSRNIIM